MSQTLPASQPGDIDLEAARGGGGDFGGACAPVAAGLAVALAGLALAARRQR